MRKTMHAMTVQRPGGPEVLQLREVPRPEPREGWTLVRVMAFGLNRSELFTRRGMSPTVSFPRVLGIECVGVVEQSHDPGLPEGTTVAAAMGGMGRQFDGSYAEFALLPTAQLMPVRTKLPWSALAAIPESYLTAYGSLEALRLRPGHRLLIRAATSSVGMAALALSAGLEVEVACTTRDPGKVESLREHGADQVILDRGGSIGEHVRAIWRDGADRVLDLVGGGTVLDSLRVLAPGGSVCNSGILSDTWVMPAFEPLEDIPSGATLTTFSSSAINTGAWARLALQDILGQVETGSCRSVIDRIFPLEELAAAHHHMETNQALGKVVAVVHHP
ncbi:zinc-binding dehydrogenase [Streptomyces roseifaciens]|uniref:zinc-binding dehydrogenase n=1 Tax=Streptomyces roseifaciens TaxID=1488406 RepID=UPI000A4C63DC|nr:zinc-binding dehydrogenase [Streptomyces roseifaciens]